MTGVRRGTGSSWGNTPSEIKIQSGGSWVGSAGSVLYRNNGTSWDEIWRWPEQVTGVSAAAIDSESISVSWTEFGWADTYYLGIREYPSGTWSYTTDATSPHTFSGLDPSTEYEVRVAARILYDTTTLTGAWSASDTATTDAAGPDAAPSGLVVSQVAGYLSSRLKLDWTDNSSDETGFRIYRNTTNSKPATHSFTVAAGVETYTDTTPEEGTLYYYWVTAYNGSGETSATTDSNNTELGALNITADVGTNPDDEIDVTWSNPTPNNAASIKAYKSTTSSSGPWSLDDTLAASATAHTFSGLAPGTQHWVMMTRTNTAAGDRDSDVEEVWTLLEAPANLAATPDATNGDTELDVSWDPVGDADGYKLYRGTSPGFTPGTPIYTGANTSYPDTGRDPNTPYYYKVRAYNTGGDGVLSGEASATTWPTVPASFNMSHDGTYLDFTWDVGTRTGESLVLQLYDTIATTWDTIATPTAGTEQLLDQTYGPEYVSGTGRIDGRIRFSSEGTYATDFTFEAT